MPQQGVSYKMVKPAPMTSPLAGRASKELPTKQQGLTWWARHAGSGSAGGLAYEVSALEGDPQWAPLVEHARVEKWDDNLGILTLSC